jgi:hypothetical protein
MLREKGVSMSSPVAKKAAKAAAQSVPTDPAHAGGPVLSPDESEKVSQVLGSLWAAGDEQLATTFTAVASAVIEVTPANMMQAKLLAQMAASHQASMECFQRAASAGDNPARRDSELRHAARFAQLYIQQYSAPEKAQAADRARAGNSRMSVEEARACIRTLGAKYLNQVLATPSTAGPGGTS